MTPRTRFAPSPTGLLHLGHAFSAIIGHDRAAAAGGVFLVRIEDLDGARCRPAFEVALLEDLRWLGLGWEDPVMRQSERAAAYGAALGRLAEAGLLYPCGCTRRAVAAALSAPQEGAETPRAYPGTCRHRPMADRRQGDSLRLNMSRALESVGSLPPFTETGPLFGGIHSPDPEALVREGDIVLARRDAGTAYHLAVVVDDAAQGVTEVVRGADLFGSTPIQILIQRLLGLPTPAYHHHRLVRDDAGRRLAKRDDARAIRCYREDGASPADIRAMLGL